MFQRKREHRLGEMGTSSTFAPQNGATGIVYIHDDKCGDHPSHCTAAAGSATTGSFLWEHTLTHAAESV